MTTTMIPVAPAAAPAPQGDHVPAAAGDGSGERFRDALRRAEAAAEHEAGSVETGDEEQPEDTAPEVVVEVAIGDVAGPVAVDAEVDADAAPATLGVEPARPGADAQPARSADAASDALTVDGTVPADRRGTTPTVQPPVVDGADGADGPRSEHTPLTGGDAVTGTDGEANPAAPGTEVPEAPVEPDAATRPTRATRAPVTGDQDAPSGVAPTRDAAGRGQEPAGPATATSTQPAATPVQDAPAAANGAAAQVHEAGPRPAAPAPAADPAPAPTMADRRAELAEQVLRTEELADSLRASFRRGERASSLSIQLHPAELGAVRVEARLVDGVTHLVLRAEQPAALDRLGGALDQLRADLADAGIDLGDLELHQGGAQDDRRGDEPAAPARSRQGEGPGRPDATTPTDRPARAAALHRGSLSVEL